MFFGTGFIHSGGETQFFGGIGFFIVFGVIALLCTLFSGNRKDYGSKRGTKYGNKNHRNRS